MTQKLWAIQPRLWPRIELISSGGQESRVSLFSNNLSTIIPGFVFYFLWYTLLYLIYKNLCK